MSTDVKIGALQSSETEFRKLSRKLGGIESSLQDIRKSLDSDIRNARNIDRYFQIRIFLFLPVFLLH